MAQQAKPALARDPFREAVNTAQGAATIARTASSADDWKLVARRWRQASQLMAAVPSSSANYRVARSRSRQYQANAAQAVQRAAAPPPRQARPPVPPRVAAARPPSPVAQPPAATVSQTTPAGPVRVPLVRRAARLSVVAATFNRSRTFPVVVDTGASLTMITQEMARSLGIGPEDYLDSIPIMTANGLTRMPRARLRSLSVGGLEVRNLTIAVVGPEVPIPLLGQDFLQNFEVTFAQDSLVLKPHPVSGG